MEGAVFTCHLPSFSCRLIYPHTPKTQRLLSPLSSTSHLLFRFTTFCLSLSRSRKCHYCVCIYMTPSDSRIYLHLCSVGGILVLFTCFISSPVLSFSLSDPFLFPNSILFSFFFFKSESHQTSLLLHVNLFTVQFYCSFGQPVFLSEVRLTHRRRHKSKTE